MPQQDNTQVTKRPITTDEALAVLAHAQQALQKTYAGKSMPTGEERMQLLHDEMETATGIRAARHSMPLFVASTHEDNVKKILEDQQAKDAADKAFLLGKPIRPLPTPSKAPAEESRER